MEGVILRVKNVGGCVLEDGLVGASTVFIFVT